MQTQIAVTGPARPAPRRTTLQHPALLHELKLTAGAVALIEAGGAPRVTLVGMRSGEPLLTQALRMALSAGLRAHARWWPDGEALDLVVERDG